MKSKYPLMRPQPLPSDARKEWQAFRRLLSRDAASYTPPVAISRTMWNAIRNAWKDGYWTRHDAERDAALDAAKRRQEFPAGWYGHRYSM